MRRSRSVSRAGLSTLAIICVVAAPALANVTVEPAPTRAGHTRELRACVPTSVAMTQGWVQSNYWDLRGLPVLSRTRLTVGAPEDAPRPRTFAPPPSWIAVAAVTEAADGSRRTSDFIYLDTDRPRADGLPIAAWSRSLDAYSETILVPLDDEPLPSTLHLGDRYVVRSLLKTVDRAQSLTRRTEWIEAVGEGILLTPAGPRESLLLRALEYDDGEPLNVAGREDRWRVSYRWICSRQGEVARVTGPEMSRAPFFATPQSVVVLGEWGDVAQGITIEKAKLPLVPRTLFLAQYYAPSGSCPRPPSPPLSTIDPAWTNAGAMISDRVTRTDPQTGSSLVDTWDFVDAGVDPATNGGTSYATFAESAIVQVRDEDAGIACPASCTTKDVTPPYANATWQYYLKFDFRNNTSGARVTRDAYLINDNDVTNPSLDVTLLSQDELACSNYSFVCFSRGPNILAKFLQFNFNGPNWTLMWDPPPGGSDRWTNTGWSGCQNSGGLAVWDAETAGTCSTSPDGFAQSGSGCASPGYGLDFEAVEDGYVRVRTGNILPSVLVRQHTALEPGALIFFVCVRPAGNRQFNYDYWWYSEGYGILARVSGPNDTTCAVTPTSWTTTDGAYFSYGLFPPYQVGAQACLGKVRVSWTRPLGCPGPNCDTERYIDNYKVYWGPTPGSKANASTLLAKTQTSYDITTGLSSPTYVSVVTTYTYADPDLGNTPYESPLSYGVSATPLVPATFVVGNNLGDGDPPPTPDAVLKVGSEIYFPWETVAGAASYQLERGTSPDPATHANYAGPLLTNTYTTTDGSGADGNDYYYEVLAYDPCGQLSTN